MAGEPCRSFARIFIQSARAFNEIPSENLAVLRRGAVIPAHLLALDADGRLDVRRQRAMTRYYLDAGAGGVLGQQPPADVSLSLPVGALVEIAEMPAGGSSRTSPPGRSLRP